MLTRLDGLMMVVWGGSLCVVGTKGFRPMSDGLYDITGTRKYRCTVWDNYVEVRPGIEKDYMALFVEYGGDIVGYDVVQSPGLVFMANLQGDELGVFSGNCIEVPVFVLTSCLLWVSVWDGRGETKAPVSRREGVCRMLIVPSPELLKQVGITGDWEEEYAAIYERVVKASES